MNKLLAVAKGLHDPWRVWVHLLEMTVPVLLVSKVIGAFLPNASEVAQRIQPNE